MKIFLQIKFFQKSVKSNNNNNINYYFQTEVRVDENEKNINNINNGRKNNLMKKNLFKEKLKEVKKIYKEDLES